MYMDTVLNETVTLTLDPDMIADLDLTYDETPQDSDTRSLINALYTDEIRLMMATLRMSQNGGLSVAECDSIPLQRHLFYYFQDRLAQNNIYLYPFEINADEANPNLIRDLSALTERADFKEIELSGHYASIIIFVYGLEALDLPARERFLQLLNFFRDRFSMISQPVVIWAGRAIVTEMARKAPDFWNWKGDVFAFPADAFDDASAKRVALIHTSPLEHYLTTILNAPEYSRWSDLYYPLQAERTIETGNVSGNRQNFNADELRQLQALFPNYQPVEAGTTIFKRGDTGDVCYVVVDGAIEIVLPDKLGQEVVLAKLEPGDFFGEIALIKRIPRTATARATHDSLLIKLTRPRLRDVAASITSILTLLNQVADRRFETIMGNYYAQDMSTVDHWNRGTLIRKSRPKPLLDLIAEDQKVVILGEAGSGKTTALRAITLRWAEEALIQQRNHNLVQVPIFLKLNELGDDKEVTHLILENLQGYGLFKSRTPDDLISLLKGNTVDQFPGLAFVFLLDGLDEIRGNDHNERKLMEFVKQFPQHRFVMTCRTQDYAPLPGFRTALLKPLEKRDIEKFLIAYLGKEQGKIIARDIYSDPQLVDLAQMPLALYMFIQITKKGAESLPKNRGVLFERFIDNMLERTDSDWWKLYERSRSKASLHLRRQVLGRLGFTMQTDRRPAVPQADWLEIIGTVLADDNTVGTPTTAELEQALIYSGLVRYSNHEQTRLEFAHQTYQEYFTALHLSEQPHPVGDMLVPGAPFRAWRNIIVLLYGITTQRGELFAEIIGDAQDYNRIWLGAQCLANTGEDITTITEYLTQSLSEERHFAMFFAVGLAGTQLGRFPEALVYLLRAAKLQPGNAEIQYEIGVLYRQLDQYDKAIRHLSEAIYLQPDFADAYNQLGITYYDQKQYEEALTVLNTTTQLQPTNPYHYYNLATVYKILKDYKKARQTFYIAMQLKPDYTQALNQLEILDQALGSAVVKTLQKVPMLKKLTLEQTIKLSERLQSSTRQPGEIIFDMGQMGETFYIIAAGEVDVLAPEMQRTVEGRDSVLNRLGEGDYFGEIALLRAVPRTATIRCATEVRLLGLERTDFDDIMTQYPSIAHNLTETSSYRLLKDMETGRQARQAGYFDAAYLRKVVQQQDEVTVVMGDIHGSTQLSQNVSSDLMIEFLDEYLKRMSTIVVKAGGAMDKSLGDSVMGVFGKIPDFPGESATSPSLRALMAALEMRQAYQELREEWRFKDANFMNSGMGVGLSTGKVSIGTIGAEGVMVGAAVNMSSKLSGMAIKGRTESEVYIDQRTYEILSDAIDVEPLDPKYVQTKSSGAQLNVYRVIRSKLEAAAGESIRKIL